MINPCMKTGTQIERGILMLLNRSGIMSGCSKCSRTNQRWWCLSNSCQVYNSELTCQQQWTHNVGQGPDSACGAWVHFKCFILCVGRLRCFLAELHQNDSLILFCWFSVQTSYNMKMPPSTPLHIIWILKHFWWWRHELIMCSRLVKTLQGSSFELIWWE